MAVAEDCGYILMAVNAACCISYSIQTINRFFIFIKRVHLGINAYAADYYQEVGSYLDRIERSLLKRIKELFSLTELRVSAFFT